MIVSGEVPAGTHLQEIPLAERLNISRTPVRRALGILAQEGLLVPGPRRGYKTRSFSIDEITDAYEVRATLEAMAAGQLAKKGTTKQTHDTLIELLAEGDRALAHGSFTQKDQLSWVAMNENIHHTIYSSTQSEMLLSFIETTYRLPLTSARHVHWYHYDSENFFLAKTAHAHHHSIISAIIERDSGRAEATMREHIRFSLDLLRKYYTGMSAAGELNREAGTKAILVET